LSGANLDSANLSGACLIDADLSFADLTLADLSGVTLYGAKLTGANFAGATCDEKTRLPKSLSDGTRYWTSNVDWKQFDAIEEGSTQKRTPQEQMLLNERRASDVRLLEKLWKSINTEQLDGTLSSLITNYRVAYETYSSVVTKYIDARNQPENHFHDPELEQVFSEFDEVLKVFDNERRQRADYYQGEKSLYPLMLTYYERAKWEGRGSDVELMDRLRDQLLGLYEFGDNVMRIHAKTIQTARRILPGWNPE
jgi:hypothetical protein